MALGAQGGLWGGTGVALGVCGVWGWHKGGIGGTEVALGVSGVQGVAQRWH